LIGHLLNRTANVKRRTVTRDGLGGSVETFAIVGNVKMRLQAISANESDVYSKEGEIITHKAFFDAEANIATRDRLRFRGNDYIIRSIINPDYEDAYLVAGVELQD
jgi:SPP1 family predicted phage head-tail adaptor